MAKGDVSVEFGKGWEKDLGKLIKQGIEGSEKAINEVAGNPSVQSDSQIRSALAQAFRKHRAEGIELSDAVKLVKQARGQ